ncbi:MAG TPA: GGDEF domain-containing protein, partial [Candidatus Omnitrophota bacterium]|nr:GGDEF domain-containing protein [Candidatus Omnitrophota bacterium]
IKFLAGTIFKDKNLSTASTLKIILYIIVFLGLISGIFYYVNIRQQKLVMFDPLTGAFARAYALERFREELKIAQGAGNKCSLLVMDVDKFKRINDTYGHTAGDTILKEFVIAIRKGVRATDLVGRFGGDEFMIILPTGEKAIALKIAQGIARIVEGTAIKVSPQLTLNITTSIGVATFPQDSMTTEDLFDKADQALYEVKKRGGNGAEAFGGNI